MFGEVLMLTAQNTNLGMNYPGTDDRQLTLNVMHRLTGYQVKAVARPLLTAH